MSMTQKLGGAKKEPSDGAKPSSSDSKQSHDQSSLGMEQLFSGLGLQSKKQDLPTAAIPLDSRAKRGIERQELQAGDHCYLCVGK
jgi:hypothetical protein